MTFSKSSLIRGSIVVLALMAWFWTQSLIGKKSLSEQGVGDSIHNMTASLNTCLANAPSLTNVILIVSSLFIDLTGIFLLGSGIFGRSIRPVLGLLIIFSLRQICQALVTLPPPPHAIWHNPGFPSLLVTYGVSNDLFFSGHTSIAVYGATELSRFRKPWLTGMGIVIALFEIVVVLILRAHYTLDVFTGAIVALLVASFIEKLSAPVDNWIVRRN
jgi:hypothetical protein